MAQNEHLKLEPYFVKDTLQIKVIKLAKSLKVITQLQTDRI